MEKYQVLKGYLDPQGKFNQLPGKRQKDRQHLMLQYLAEQFDLGKKYTEMEVNEILNQHHSFQDPATLRRLMFGKKLINRTLDGRTYWLVPK